MSYRSIFFTIGSVLLSGGMDAQEITDPRQLGRFDGTPIRYLDEVNALVFKPDGYDTVMNPRLPDSLSSLMMLSKEELKEMYRKRFLFNPYLVFGSTIELKKEAVFIGFSTSWIRLSAYYKYNNDDSSAEDFRKKVNRNLLGKNMVGYAPGFELLEDVTGSSRELINADTVFIYDTGMKYRFRDTVDNYGSLVVHLVKFDLGYVSLRYFYPLDQRERALSEINDTWGVVQFKPDSAFRHPNRDGWIPAPTEPELYFGKFSFLNNPEQLVREQEQYRQRKLKGEANAMAGEGVRLFKSANFGRAREKLFDALNIDSGNVIAYRHLVLMSMDENNRDESRGYLKRMIEIEPENSETWFLKGLVEKNYGELDNAVATFEMITKDRDSLHFRSFIELATISVLNGEYDAADIHFNRAIAIFNNEGVKALRNEDHRMLDINDLFMVRLAYAGFLNANSAFGKSKMLFEQTLEDEARAIEADEKGERRHVYGKLTITNLRELYFLLAMSHVGLKDEVGARKYLEDAKRFGKALPEELKRLLDD